MAQARLFNNIFIENVNVYIMSKYKDKYITLRKNLLH